VWFLWRARAGSRGISPLGVIVGLLVVVLGVIFLLGSLGIANLPVVTLSWLQELGAIATIAVGAVVIWAV
jgi:hypothetical protein